MNLTITKRKFLQFSSAAVVGSALLMPAAAFAVTTLDLSEVLPEENWQTQAILAWAADVEEASGGELVVNVHSGGALGFKGPEHLNTVAGGLVPMADLLLAQATGNEPIFKVENLPFLVSSPEELAILHKHLRPAIDEAAARNNQKFLTTMPSPQNSIYMEVKADSLEELANVKVRGADMTSVETFNALGMTGIQIPWGELIPALATGRVDGVGTSPTSAVDGKFWEFLEYIYPTNHVWATNVLSINLDTWNGLSPELQQVLLDVSAKHEPLFWEASKELGEAAQQTLLDNGMEVVEISPEMRAAMEERTRPIIDSYVEEVPAAAPIIEAYLEEVGRN